MNGNPPIKRGVPVLRRGRRGSRVNHGNRQTRQQTRPLCSSAAQRTQQPQVALQSRPKSNLNPNAQAFDYQRPVASPIQSFQSMSIRPGSHHIPIPLFSKLDSIPEETEDEVEPWPTESVKLTHEEDRKMDERHHTTGKLLVSPRRVYNIARLLSCRDNTLCSSPPSDFNFGDILADCSMIDRTINAMKEDRIELRQPQQQTCSPRSRFNRVQGRSTRRTLSSRRRRLPKLEKDKLMNKTRGILNKITPDKFDLLSRRLTELLDEQVSCLEHLEVVLDAILCVGIDQPGFAVQYASLLNYLSQQLRRVASNWDWVHDSTYEPRTLVKRIVQELCAAKHNVFWYETTPCHEDFLLEVASEDDVVLSGDICCTIGGFVYDDSRLDKAKSKLIGLEVMVGQLCIQRIVSKEIVCVGMINPLLRLRNDCRVETEAWRGDITAIELEAVCKLLAVCGRQLDGKGRAWLDVYFRVLTEQTACLGARMRFMVMDLVDLRAAQWDRPRKAQCPHLAKPHPSKSKMARASNNNARRRGRSSRGRFSPSTKFHRAKKY